MTVGKGTVPNIVTIYHLVVNDEWDKPVIITATLGYDKAEAMKTEMEDANTYPGSWVPRITNKYSKGTKEDPTQSE